MIRPALAVVFALAAGTAAAADDEVRLMRPIEAATIATDDFTLVAYFVPVAGDGLEVVATWLGSDDAEPRRLMMRLADRDSVRLALPGHLDTLFTFARDLDAVTIATTPAPIVERTASL